MYWQSQITLYLVKLLSIFEDNDPNHCYNELGKRGFIQKIGQ